MTGKLHICALCSARFGSETAAADHIKAKHATDLVYRDGEQPPARPRGVPRQKRRSRCPKPDRSYSRLWRIVDGAVADAFNQHPEYLKGARRSVVQNSITKRVTGAVMGFASEQARGRSGSQSSGCTGEDGALTPLPARWVDMARRVLRGIRIPKQQRGGDESVSPHSSPAIKAKGGA